MKTSKLLRSPWKRLVTNKEVYYVALTESELLSHVKSTKLRYLGHVLRLSYDNIESSVNDRPMEGTRGRGRLRIGWIANITT